MKVACRRQSLDAVTNGAGERVTIEPEPLYRILVAEDSAADRLILQSMLLRAGYDVAVVEDGKSAVAAFTQYRPDIVFLDVMMPNLNGIEAAKQIKKLAGDELIPVIFLTSLADAESLATCLDAGGDDFISKPYNQVVLDAKIRSFARMREMHVTLSAQKNQISLHNQHLLQEQTVAKQVFDKIAHAGALHLDIIRYYTSALAVFNGDVLLAEVSPRGSLFVIIGDFTGHGLPAAIGAMPLASTFYGMVSKGFYMPDILREINQKLYQTLPVGLFCCAACVDIDFQKGRLSVWNGGLPENVLYRGKTNSYETIKSRHLPLGVLSQRDFKVELDKFHVEEGDHLLMWSDGIIESRDPEGAMFGEARTKQILAECTDARELYTTLIKSVQTHIGSSEKDDDISLVDIEIPTLDTLETLMPKPGQGQGSGYLVDWSLSLKLDATSLRTFNPMSMLINMMSEVPGLRQSSSILYTLLSELYNNAIEHGVLGLASQIKSSPSGFADYYRLRKEGLASLKDAFVQFDFKHTLDDAGGRLEITVADSGAGFSHADYLLSSDQRDHARYFGRGLSLIASFCETVEIIHPGNKVKASYRWYFEEAK